MSVVRAPTFVITAADVRRYLSMPSCITAVEGAFRALARGGAEPPVTVGLHARGGGFHIKAALLDLNRRYFVVKANGNFPQNPAQGLPTIQGLAVLCDADNGRVLAVIDSIELTAVRTAAATALAARYLASARAQVVTICGCGVQAAAQLRAIALVRDCEKFLAVDVDEARARSFAAMMQTEHGLPVTPAAFSEAVAAAPDIWITCTTSYEFFLFPEHVKAGAFVAGVGVDNPTKRELAPALLERAHVVTDRTGQCEEIGDLHHAMEAGVTPRSVCELGEIVAGMRPARHDNEAIYVFDSTGIAIQDLAAAAAVFEAAKDAHENGDALTVIDFGA